jgi:hypothetical protein
LAAPILLLAASYGLKDSVAKGPTFQPKKTTVKRAEKYFEGMGKKGANF